MIRQGRETAEERWQKKSRLCFQAQAAFAYWIFAYRKMYLQTNSAARMYMSGVILSRFPQSRLMTTYDMQPIEMPSNMRKPTMMRASAVARRTAFASILASCRMFGLTAQIYSISAYPPVYSKTIYCTNIVKFMIIV